MKDAKDRPVWFSEPSQADDSWGRRGESVTSWVERATLPRAQATRRFLNENLSALPKEHQAALHKALHDRWPSAFFELIVARTLQVLGASIEVEPGGAEDIRIDFVASFPDSTVSVEAVAPAFNLEVGEKVKHRNPLLDIVESLAPPDLWVLVEALPELGPSDSKRRFKNAVGRLLADATEANVSSPTEFVEELPQGTLRIKVTPKCSNVSTGRSIGIEPALTAFDDTENRVRRAVDRKRRQGREGAMPTLLAIHATGISRREDRGVVLEHGDDQDVYVRAALYDTAGGFYAAHSRHLDPPQVKSLGADEYAHSWGAESAPPDAGHPYATPPRGTSIRC